MFACKNNTIKYLTEALSVNSNENYIREGLLLKHGNKRREKRADESGEIRQKKGKETKSGRKLSIEKNENTDLVFFSVFLGFPNELHHGGDETGSQSPAEHDEDAANSGHA